MVKFMTKLEIKHALERRGISQASIATENDVSPATVNLVISGRCTSFRIQKAIAAKLNKPVEEVFKITGTPGKTGPK